MVGGRILRVIAGTALLFGVKERLAALALRHFSFPRVWRPKTSGRTAERSSKDSIARFLAKLTSSAEDDEKQTAQARCWRHELP